MLVIVMTLGEVLFNSRAVGRLGRCSFSFSGRSLTSRFFTSKLQFRRLFKRSPINATIFQTIFPYRGDAWGTWSQVTYLNQRHFASAIGILLVVFVFLVMPVSRRGS
jgi:hypothetical protein